MDVVVGWVLVLAGVVLQHVSLRTVLRANAETLVPYWSRPDVIPRGSTALRAWSVVPFVIGLVQLGSALDPWVVIVGVLLAVPGFVAIVLHNRRVAAGA